MANGYYRKFCTHFANSTFKHRFSTADMVFYLGIIPFGRLPKWLKGAVC